MGGKGLNIQSSRLSASCQEIQNPLFRWAGVSCFVHVIPGFSGMLTRELHALLIGLVLPMQEITINYYPLLNLPFAR